MFAMDSVRGAGFYPMMTGKADRSAVAGCQQLWSFAWISRGWFGWANLFRGVISAFRRSMAGTTHRASANDRDEESKNERSDSASVVAASRHFPSLPILEIHPLTPPLPSEPPSLSFITAKEP